MSNKKNKTKSSSKYKVEVDRNKCISAASCVAIADQTFALDKDDVAKVICQDCDDDQAKLLAAKSCPTGAIIVKNNDTKEKIWPKV